MSSPTVAAAAARTWPQCARSRHIEQTGEQRSIKKVAGLSLRLDVFLMSRFFE